MTFAAAAAACFLTGLGVVVGLRERHARRRDRRSHQHASGD
jgi:hypothetical protein